MTALSALHLVCTLKPSPAESSSQLISERIRDELAKLDVDSEIVRVVDHDVKFGVEIDMGDGDAWPQLRQKMLDADILVVSTPIWMGQPASVCKMVLERLDAELSETDDEGRLLTYGKVAVVAVVGNEDGAHHTSAECFQALSDVGFTIPAAGVTYWVGEAMQGVDYNEMDPEPEKTRQTTATAVANAVHLARLLQGAPYPAGG